MTEQIPSILSKDSFWNEKSTRCLSGELFLMTLSLNPAKASTGNCEKNIQHLKIGDEFKLFGKQQQTFKTDKRKMQGHPLSLSHKKDNFLTSLCNLDTILKILDWITTVYYISKPVILAWKQYNAVFNQTTKEILRKKLPDNSQC